MHKNSAKLIIFIVLVAATVVDDVNALKCVDETPCSCHLLDGSYYDLSEVSPKSPLIGVLNDYKFSFQPCKDVKMDLDPSVPFASTACNNRSGVSLCAEITGSPPPFSLGTTLETKWNLPDSNNVELVLTHETNTSRISLLCCKTCKTSTLSLDGEPVSNQFHFTLSSSGACKREGPPEGLSTGSVLVILLFVFSGVYLLVGALTLRFFRGAIGWELIPNYDFWSDLPALVRDGVAYTFSGCSADSYDRI